MSIHKIFENVKNMKKTDIERDADHGSGKNSYRPGIGDKGKI